MKWLDGFLRDWRIDQALTYADRATRLLDIGCGDGTLFRRFRGRWIDATGIDPNVSGEAIPGVRLVRGHFPDDLPADARPFNFITLLATIEHIPEKEQHRFAQACSEVLEHGGIVVVTIPSPLVDPILHGLKSMRLIDGMSLEEHYGFDHRSVVPLFAAAGLECIVRRRFQLGLNNLFVFRRP